MIMGDLTPEDTGIGRVPAIQALLRRADNHECCSLVGVSNMGKSVVLRALTQPRVLSAFWGADARRYLVVYIDCNRMLHLGEQGFYELVLRCLRESSACTDGHDPLGQVLEETYADIVAPSSDLAMPLAFNRAINALMEDSSRCVVFLLDEFDEPLRILDGRVLLNLRALQDQYTDRVSYITATCGVLETIRNSQEAGIEEFFEVFSTHLLYLGPMARADSERFLRRRMVEEPLSSTTTRQSGEIVSLLAEETGGHPGLLRAVLSCVETFLTGSRARRSRATTKLPALFDQDVNVHSECRKLWNDLSSREQRALEDLTRLGTSRLSQGIRDLMQKGLVVESEAGLRAFAPIWERYVVAQYQSRRPGAAGVRMDVQNGEVWVDDRLIPYLTPLENRLLLMLYGHLGQVCTKEAIIEAVYGREYFPNDDPTLQRLVRRLREKVESDPSHPRYIRSVRGYGYKLAEVKEDVS